MNCINYQTVKKKKKSYKNQNNIEEMFLMQNRSECKLLLQYNETTMLCRFINLNIEHSQAAVSGW